LPPNRLKSTAGRTSPATIRPNGRNARSAKTAVQFADNADFKLEEQIYIDAKAPYYELANNTPKLTEKEFLAQFGSE